MQEFPFVMSEPPSNCRFEVCDANKDLDRYPALSFNVVHMRTVLQGIKDYQALFYQAARMLRPGGVFLIVDGTWAAFDVNKNRIQAENPEKPVRWTEYRINKLVSN